MKKKKTLKAREKANAAIFSIVFIHLRFLCVLGFVISQWVCLLAVLEPRVWMSYAHSARWVYATLYLALLMGLLFTGLLALKLSALTRSFFVRLCLGSMYSAAILFFLFDERFSAALLLSFGWSAFAALKNWLIPPKEKDDNMPAALKNWFHPFSSSSTEQEENMKPFRRTYAVAQSVFFVLLIGTLAVHSVFLSTLLFAGKIGYMMFLSCETYERFFERYRNKSSSS